MLALMVSGGDSSLIRMAEVGRYEIIGSTIDDAAGEALDKAAALLELGYPGGPVIQKRQMEAIRKPFVFHVDLNSLIGVSGCIPTVVISVLALAD